MSCSVAGFTLQVIYKDGNDIGSPGVPVGAVYSLKVEDGEIEVLLGINKGVRVPATHEARNIGSTRYREVLVGTSLLNVHAHP